MNLTALRDYRQWLEDDGGGRLFFRQGGGRLGDRLSASPAGLGEQGAQLLQRVADDPHATAGAERQASAERQVGAIPGLPHPLPRGPDLQPLPSRQTNPPGAGAAGIQSLGGLPGESAAPRRAHARGPCDFDEGRPLRRCLFGRIRSGVVSDVGGRHRLSLGAQAAVVDRRGDLGRTRPRPKRHGGFQIDRHGRHRRLEGSDPRQQQRQRLRLGQRSKRIGSVNET